MSGRKNVILPYHVVRAGDASADITSTPINIQYLDNAGLQVKSDGTAAGTIFVDASINGVDYEELDFGASMSVSGPSSFLVNMQQLPYISIRIRYVAASGTGTLDVWVAAKEI